jgi:hypothetical protein
MAETPANTPKPIGNTSSFFPGGSKGAAAPAFSEAGVGDGDRDEDFGGATVDVPRLSGREPVGGPVFPGCGAAGGFGPGEDGRTTLLELVLLEGSDTELLSLGRGTKVSVTEITGDGTGTELAAGKSVTVETGGTVLGGTSLEVEESIPLVLVKLGGESEVEDGNSVDTVGLDAGGGGAPGTSPLPLSGVSTHVFSSLTMSTPSTTVGVRLIVHVWMNVPTPVVILSVCLTVTGRVNLVSCLGNTADVWEYGEGYAPQKSKISKQKAKRKRRKLGAVGSILGKEMNE